MSERWRNTYDQWKLATPPEHDAAPEMCEACARGDHANCGRQSWCECDCDGAVEPGDDWAEIGPYE